ncbi:flavin reductase family protein [Actinomycetospora flava]|uniref:Flavin reductase family protein n=1 Tax=Actinomycetospora flava TaxID=3129232 RepID=A0ABU8M4A0_9PSEU
MTASGGPDRGRVEPQEFRELMGGVCAPVTVISTRTAEGAAHGTTVSAFASLSLEPPMVSVALDRDSALLAHARRSGRLGINVLAHDQAQTATTFARSGPDKFADASWEWDTGMPRLAGVAGWLVADIEQEVAGGDHVILLGGVVRAESTPALPLVYARRTFGSHSALVGAPAVEP